mgnify:CR=1 FL=1
MQGDATCHIQPTARLVQQSDIADPCTVQIDEQVERRCCCGVARFRPDPQRSTVQRLRTVGNGMGPATRAPVRLAVSTISVVD